MVIHAHSTPSPHAFPYHLAACCASSILHGSSLIHVRFITFTVTESVPWHACPNSIGMQGGIAQPGADALSNVELCNLA